MCGTGREILCINDHIADFGEAQTERLLAALPEWRRATAMRYKHLQGRRECAAAYIELLRGLRLSFGIEGMPSFNYNEHGKPFLKEHPGVHLSISHCKAAVGCFICERPCGLDIEHIRKARPELVRHTMNPQETEAIFTSPFPDVAFTRLWTQKEAVLKLKGTGITDDLHNVLDPNRLEHIQLETTENLFLGYIFTIATHTNE